MKYYKIHCTDFYVASGDDMYCTLDIGKARIMAYDLLLKSINGRNVTYVKV